MAVFRLQENVPDVYQRLSRDFQLMCNLFDCVNGGVKQDIDSMVNILNTQKCSERLLPLLQNKLGFFSTKHMTASELRLVLTGFVDIVKDKGCKLGISEAIEVFLKVCHASKNSQIRLTNVSEADGVSITRLHNSYIVDVAIESDAVDTTLLTEILKYVLPAGYQLEYSFYKSSEQVDIVEHSDTINIVFVDSRESNSVKELPVKDESPDTTGVGKYVGTTRTIETSQLSCDDEILSPVDIPSKEIM